ncbi:unnamed protein product [Boreogadus saida]
MSKVTTFWLWDLAWVYGAKTVKHHCQKDTMDIWCNGQKMETAGEFVEDGTETQFTLGNHDCCIKAVSCGKRRDCIIHTLLVDTTEIPE